MVAPKWRKEELKGEQSNIRCADVGFARGEKGKMKLKRATVRQSGQLTLPSSFRSNSISSSKDGKAAMGSKPSNTCISLSDFLDRKVDKTVHRSVQEKQKSFSTVNFGLVKEKKELKQQESSADFVLSEAVFEHFKPKSTAEGCMPLSGKDEAGIVEIESKGESGDSGKSKNPLKVSRVGGKRSGCQQSVVVLGDDPKPKLRRKGHMLISKRPKTSFNHYANGSGWWDCNMEGVDSEEVGCHDVWEGVGSTTLGGLEWH